MRVDAVVAEIERHAFGEEQRLILSHEAGFRLGEDAAEIVTRQRLELDADRQAALQLGQQVGGFGDMEGARRDEENMVGFDRPIFGRHRRAFDERQEIALHAFAAHIGTLALGAGADLVDLVEEHDAVVFG